MNSEKKIRKAIFKKIVELFGLREKKQKFFSGETLVNYASRVYDEKELIKGWKLQNHTISCHAVSSLIKSTLIGTGVCRYVVSVLTDKIPLFPMTT